MKSLSFEMDNGDRLEFCLSENDPFYEKLKSPDLFEGNFYEDGISVNMAFVRTVRTFTGEVITSNPEKGFWKKVF